MDFETTVTIESKAAPGVKFTVRRLNKIERAKRDAPLADAREELSRAVREAQALYETVEVEQPDGKPPVKEERVIAGKEIEFSRAMTTMEHVKSEKIMPPMIRAGLVSVEGLTIGGEVLSHTALGAVEVVIACAPDDLLDEIFEACVEASSLTAEQLKN